MIATEGDRVYIVGKNLNCFVVPGRAFSNAEHKHEFLINADTWWKNASDATITE